MESLLSPLPFLTLVLFFPTSAPPTRILPPILPFQDPFFMLSAVCGASDDRHCHPINIIAAAPSPPASWQPSPRAIGSPLLRAPPPLIYLCLRRRRRRRRLRHQCIVKRAQSAFSSPSIRERLSILPYAPPLPLSPLSRLHRLPSPPPPTTHSLFSIAVLRTQGTTNLLLPPTFLLPQCLHRIL